MSVNASTYLQYNYVEIIADAGFEQLSTADLFVYGLVVGVVDDSASAVTGNWVGSANDITTTNREGVKITAATPFSISPMAIGNEILAVNVKDYFVATTSGDVIYYAYLEEKAIV